ncbi:Rv3235 family protein [Psychromicrobium sp. YIM B11713]|uniref:Rv3235 family protein n=1 Tax=Psychromicrobium sp. YIM B11713 TaxID=3145233 RepID=UPI00374FCB58
MSLSPSGYPAATLSPQGRIPGEARSALPVAGTSAVTRLPTSSAQEVVKIRQLAASVAKASLETLAGTRQARQLSRLLSQEAFSLLERRADLTQKARSAQRASVPNVQPALYQRPQIRSAHSCRVAPGIYEISVVIMDRQRYRAMALRIEQIQGRWLVTVLQIG